MRILFDQSTPVPVRRALTTHFVKTAREQSCSTLSNGDLLAAAEKRRLRIASHYGHKFPLPTESQGPQAGRGHLDRKQNGAWFALYFRKSSRR